MHRCLSLTTVKMNPMEEYYYDKINYYLPSIKINMVIKDEFNYQALEFIYSEDFAPYLKGIMKKFDSIRKNDIKNIIDTFFIDLKFKNTKCIVNN